MATTLPRPSRPSMGPPDTALPALPVSKVRDSTSSTISASDSPRASSSSLRPPASLRATSSSALPTKTPQRDSASLSTAPNPLSAVSGIAPPGKLRKTISIGSFPQPPRGLNSASKPSSPLSAGATPTSKMPPPSGSSVPMRGSSLRRSSSKMSTTSLRSVSLKVPLTPPTLLNGSWDSHSVTLPNSSLLSIPSPPQSRTSSAQDSYASATTFEDMDGEDIRGRESTEKSEGKFEKDGKGNVLVSVRVRPDAGSDGARPEHEWMVDGRRSLISYKGKEAGEYIYDNVFATHDNNARVYDAAAKRLVRRVMEGYHGTVFAYGMTGTGKTFSMQGTASSPGVIPLAITDIFSYIRETPHREFLLRVSYLEIYNERINDLLTPPTLGPTGQPIEGVEIKLREDSKRGVYATPLKEEIVQSPTQLLRVIARGDSARRVAGTQFNARSSRSHAVVQIVVESRERVAGSAAMDTKRGTTPSGGVRVSTLSLIDLAGSERAAEDKARRTEGAHINKSLLTLGTVIANLSGEMDDKKAGDKKGEKGKHLPYRDSKLTRLLQPALSGNSLVSILCTIQIGSAGSVATAHTHTGETLNTLKFASRAKNNIVSHAKKAEEATDAGSRALLDRYRIEISELRKQLEEAQTATKHKVEQEDKHVEEEEERAREFEQEARHGEQMLEIQLARTALKERIEHLNRLILSSKSIGVNNANRSISSMSTRNRGSVATIDSRPVSARSSTISQILEVPKSRASSVSRDSVGTVQGNGVNGDNGSEEDDVVGENGDGIATAALQIRALQADLADKNRYIGTLEKRLLQARRSSHSRVSMSLAPRIGMGEEGGLETVIKDKDAEIADLRARLDDKDRMITALRSSARKRDAADLLVESAPQSSTSSPEPRRRFSHQRSENGSIPTGSFRNTPPTSPVGLGLLTDKRAKDVEEMTRILDEMITESAAGGNSGHALRRGSNLKVVSEAQ